MHLANREASETYQRIVYLRKSINLNFWELVEKLKIARDNRHWVIMDCESWAAYLAQPEIDLNEKTVKDYIYIFDNISKCIKKSDMSDKMIQLDVDIGKLKLLAPHVNKENIENLLEKAKTLSRSDLRHEIRDLKNPRTLEGLPEGFVMPENAQIIHNDFRKVELPDNSVDVIITDPPYPREFLPLYEDLSLFASKVLKPSGFCIAYSGELHLPEVINLMSKHLTYYWTLCLFQGGPTQIVMGRNIMAQWKPILVYQKPPFKKLEYVVKDYYISENREKDGHEWQQSESGVRKIIENFSEPGDTVLDPFSGAGTFPKVAHDLKRKAIGIEIDEHYYKVSKARFNDKT